MTLQFPVDPMKATLGSVPRDDEGWAFEVKWDGYRTLAFVANGRVRLQSSNRIDVTAKYPELAGLADSLGPDRVVLDGELVVVDDAGRPRFELIQQHTRQAALYVFDVLAVGDVDTIGLPYEERRGVLAGLVEAGSNWTVPAHRIGEGSALAEATAAQELEGIMAKKLGSTYRPGTRTRHWLKIKHRRRTDVVIGGYTTGSSSRSTTFGALLVGRWDGDRLAFAGGVGSGFTQRLLEQLSARLRDLADDECPFDPPPPRSYLKGARWVRPDLTATIEITEFTNEGFVRQAAYITGAT